MEKDLGPEGYEEDGREFDDYRMRGDRRRLPDHSGLYEDSQKHLPLDFELLDYSDKNLDLLDCSQKSQVFLGEDAIEFDKRNKLEAAAAMRNGQQTMNGNGFSGAFIDGLDMAGMSSHNMIGTSSSVNNSLHLGTGQQLSLNYHNESKQQNGFDDTINSEQDNQIIGFLSAGGGVAELGIDLQLSQQSLGLGSLLNNYHPNDEEQSNEDVKEGLGSETVSFQKFEGRYNFKITPLDKGKCCFSVEHNKFYCDIGTYEFNITMNFQDIRNPEKFIIRAALLFTEPQHQNNPVIKCINCAETQKKFLNDKEKAMVTYHIVRGHQDDSQVDYVISEKTKYCYALIGVRHPEPGCETLVQKLAFTCRSSCKSNTERGICRRPTALVFTLLDHRKEVCGRSVINLRICSAPFRDFKAEFKAAAMVYQAQQGKARKTARKSTATTSSAVAPSPKKGRGGARGKRQQKEQDEEEGESESDEQTRELPPVTPETRQQQQQLDNEADDAEEPPAKLAKVGTMASYCETEQLNDEEEEVEDDEPIPSTSTKPLSTMEFDVKKALEMLHSNSQDSSSQESLIEFEENGIRHSMKLKAFAKECRKVLYWINSRDLLQRSAAIQVFESLKFTQAICCKSKQMIEDVQSRYLPLDGNSRIEGENS